MKIYVSGPISGYEEGNLPAFRDAATYLEKFGYEVVVPHDITPWPHDGECPAGYAHNLDHSSACFLRADLAELLKCDAIFMLSGWEASIGARLEHSVAAHCGLLFYYETHQELT